MAQRNPMNDRYMGEGPQGKTRKSAAKLKPKSEAASTVHIEKKPTNKSERKAARKKRDAQLAAKDKERQRKAEERERKEREAAGEIIEAPPPPTMLEKVKHFFFPPKPTEPTKGMIARGETKKDASGKEVAALDPATEKEKARERAREHDIATANVAGVPTWRGGPDTPQYRRLKYIYWSLMGCSVFFILIMLMINVFFVEALSGYGIYVIMALAYPTLIAAFVLDATKIKKIQRAHRAGGQGKLSPKQQKHVQQQAEAARLLEESKKAQKELKRANSKIPFVKGKSQTEASSDDLIAEAYDDIDKEEEETT